MLVCGESICRLACEGGCRIFDIEKSREKEIDMTWEGVGLCLDFLLKRIGFFRYVVGIERGGLVLALWISNVYNVRHGIYRCSNRVIWIGDSGMEKESREGDIFVIDDIEDSSKTLIEFKDTYKYINNIGVLVKRVGCRNLAKEFAIVLDSDKWIVFPWERLEYNSSFSQRDFGDGGRGFK